MSTQDPGVLTSSPSQTQSMPRMESPWMFAKSEWIMQASLPGEPRGAFGAHGRGRSYSRGGGDQGYGSGRYDSRPGGYGYGCGRSRDYSGSHGGCDRYSGGNYRDNYDN